MKRITTTKLIMLFIMGISSIMAISSVNLFMIWASLELNLFSFIPLLINSASIKETEASINYFLSQSLGSTILLMSSTMLLTSYFFMEYNTLLILMTLLLKMGAAPCQYWYPMTMNLSSWMNCILLSTWQKLAPMFITLYIIMPKMSKMTIIMIASINALMGGIMGLNQTSLKKIMSYSSITHMGWMLSMPLTNTPCLSILYFMIYSMMVFPLFMMFHLMKLNKTNELWNKQLLPSTVAFFMMTMLLSLGGLPPLGGFFPKLLMINMLLKSSMVVTALLIIGSLFNMFFYLNITLNIILEKSKKIITPYSTLMKMNMVLALLSSFLGFSIIII